MRNNLSPFVPEKNSFSVIQCSQHVFTVSRKEQTISYMRFNTILNQIFIVHLFTIIYFTFIIVYGIRSMCLYMASYPYAFIRHHIHVCIRHHIHMCIRHHIHMPLYGIISIYLYMASYPYAFIWHHIHMSIYGIILISV
jgi:hypothetical protein